MNDIKMSVIFWPQPLKPFQAKFEDSPKLGPNKAVGLMFGLY